MPRRFSRSRGPKKLDHTQWALSTGSSQAQAAGAVAINFSTVGTTPATLLRIRGEILVFLDGSHAPGKLIQVTYGIILVPEGTGTTVVFDPVLDANAPWLLYGQGTLGYDEPVTDVIDIPVATGFRHTIDNKAMRIIRPDIEMQMVVQNSTIGTSASSNFVYGLRWLLGF